MSHCDWAHKGHSGQNLRFNIMPPICRQSETIGKLNIEVLKVVLLFFRCQIVEVILMAQNLNSLHTREYHTSTLQDKDNFEEM